MIHKKYLQYAALGAVLLPLFATFVYQELNHMNAAQLESQREEAVPLQGLMLKPINDKLKLQPLPSDVTRTTADKTQSNRIVTHGGDAASLPPFSSLVDSFGNVTGDVSFLLEFAIIG